MIASITGTDYAVVVTEPTVSGIHDLKRVLDTIDFFNVSCGIIVNKSDLNQQKSEEIMQIAEQRGADFIGQIIYDKSITLSQMQAMPVVQYTDNKMTQQIKDIWKKIKKIIFQQ